MCDRIALNRKIGILRKLEIDDVAGILEIDEDEDFLGKTLAETCSEMDIAIAILV
jgi:hypothetical protein